MQSQIAPADAIVMYTVYRRPADYPDEYVIRRWWTDGGGVYAEIKLYARAKTLADARAQLPADLVRLPAQPDDEEQIVETWL